VPAGDFLFPFGKMEAYAAAAFGIPVSALIKEAEQKISCPAPTKL
jgi:hypothetical protein